MEPERNTIGGVRPPASRHARRCAAYNLHHARRRHPPTTLPPNAADFVHETNCRIEFCQEGKKHGKDGVCLHEQSTHHIGRLEGCTGKCMSTGSVDHQRLVTQIRGRPATTTMATNFLSHPKPIRRLPADLMKGEGSQRRTIGIDDQNRREWCCQFIGPSQAARNSVRVLRRTPPSARRSLFRLKGIGGRGVATPCEGDVTPCRVWSV
ncbi:hypothetical protein LX36DRAFT_658034 [Colletotrichum falcatum]|nr:hypothetical protein LX36DRAFT_658034 [Colletotrichum falcatum]